MTFAELAHQIGLMTDEQRNKTATVYVADTDEFMPVLEDVKVTAETDVLDENHPYIFV